MGKRQQVESAREKRLADAPKRVRSLYQGAWSGRSRKKAVRAFCLECVQWLSSEVDQCSSPACPLYEYRLGTAPQP